MTDRLVLRATAPDAQLEALRHRLYVGRTLVPTGWEAHFRRKARYRSAHTSTVIEGNPLGHDAAVRVLVEDAQTLTSSELELKNLDEAYDLVQQMAADPSVRVDEGLIRTMNSIMLKGLPTPAARSRGRYRLGTNLIVNDRTREIRYRPPAAERVSELMASFVNDVQQWIDERTYPGAVIAALAHFGLVSIHPFDDGNGRTGRLLADMILYKAGWSNEGMVSVSQAILNRQQDYYDALRATQGADFTSEVDATLFVQFHTEALEASAIELESEVVSFNARRDAVSAALGDRLRPRQLLGLMFMMDIAPLSTSLFAELSGVSTSRALSELTHMVEQGWIERVGGGRNTRYRVQPGLEQPLHQARDPG